MPPTIDGTGHGWSSALLAGSWWVSNLGRIACRRPIGSRGQLLLVRAMEQEDGHRSLNEGQRSSASQAALLMRGTCRW